MTETFEVTQRLWKVGPMDKELEALIKRTRGYKMTPEEYEAQRQSYIRAELGWDDTIHSAGSIPTPKGE